MGGADRRFETGGVSGQDSSGEAGNLTDFVSETSGLYPEPVLGISLILTPRLGA